MVARKCTTNERANAVRPYGDITKMRHAVSLPLRGRCPEGADEV